MPLEWMYLLTAGIMEMGWPLGFKMAQTSETKVLWIALSIMSMAASGFFLYLAQRTIPLGTAYAVWTGIGAVGTFAIGILVFKDPASMLRVLSAALVVFGIVGLKLSH